MYLLWFQLSVYLLLFILTFKKQAEHKSLYTMALVIIIFFFYVQTDFIAIFVEFLKYSYDTTKSKW